MRSEILSPTESSLTFSDTVLPPSSGTKRKPSQKAAAASMVLIPYAYDALHCFPLLKQAIPIHGNVEQLISSMSDGCNNKVVCT
jgi:hypothetical protein